VKACCGVGAGEGVKLYSGAAGLRVNVVFWIVLDREEDIGSDRDVLTGVSFAGSLAHLEVSMLRVVIVMRY